MLMLMLMAVVVMVGGRGAGVSLLTPAQPRWRAGMPLALLMACIWHWSDCWSRAELRHCLVLPHLLRARVNPCILVLLPKASQHRAFIVWVFQEKVLSSMGEEGEKKGIVLFCYGQMQAEERSHVPTAHSQPVGALPSTGLEGFQVSCACPQEKPHRSSTSAEV